MVLVTGGSGFIGGHVARALSEDGESVRLLLRPGSDRRGIADLAYEEALGDLRDRDAVRRAAEGCKSIFHVAADYRLWSKRPQDLYESNVEGTRNVLAAAREAGVERLVYTGTVGTLALPADGRAGDERATLSLKEVQGHYKRSKLLAERAVREAAAGGLPAVIVQPTAPVGDGDVKPTPTGRIVVDFLRGAMPAYVDTGLNLVDVRDVARGHLLAAERGLAGQGYILGAQNWSLRQILEALGRLTGQRPPRFRAPYGLAWAFGALETAWAGLTGRPPQAPLEAVRMARKKMYFRSDKAERELGWRPGPVEEALQRAILWFRENGYC